MVLNDADSVRGLHAPNHNTQNETVAAEPRDIPDSYRREPAPRKELPWLRDIVDKGTRIPRIHS